MTVRFIDDCVNNSKDAEMLQNDLDRVVSWSSKSMVYGI